MSDVSNSSRRGDGEVVSEKRAKQGRKGIHALTILVSSLTLAGIAAALLLSWALGWL
jgi:hypothetical protein